MQGGRSKDLVAFAAVLAATMFGTWLFVRAQLDLGAGWTDGEARYDNVGGERIRYAVWDRPELLGGDVNGEEQEDRPALSPDGRWLVFSVGERGLNADLYLAELRGGEPVDPHPIGILNTAADELAPAFGPDGLYFASDSGGPSFGLDLFRADFADGVFGPPESIGSGINTAADETDPCPVPGSRDLVFSSNRERGQRVDFDLYRATPEVPAAPEPHELGEPSEPGPSPEAAEGKGPRFVVTDLAPLNTPFEEREPALTSDGRTLIFATDRTTELGFDLFRSFHEDGAWLPPEPLVGVNTERDERGPLLSADGFSLYFSAAAAEERADLFRARSKELFRLPTPPLSLAEILLLLTLFLLALLAWLSKRWRTIDVIYKCFLISLLVHLALMWYLREVYPEAGPVELAAGEEQTFRVRLAPSPTGTPTASRERGGELELTARRVEEAQAAPSRAESGVELAAAAPSRSEVSAPERELEAPARRDAELGENRSADSAAPSLQEREAPFERLQENAPGLALAARAAQAAPTPTEAANPNRAATTAEAQRAAPSTAEMRATRDPDDAGSRAPAPLRLTQTSDAGVPDRTEVAQPAERFEARRATAPAMQLPDATAVAAPERVTGAAARRDVSADTPTFSPGEAQPTTGNPADLAVERPAERGPSGPKTPTLETRVARGDPDVDLRELHEAPRADAESRESRRFDATSELAQASTSRSQPDASDPERFDVSPSRVARADAVPTQRDLSGLEPVRDPEQTDELASGRSERDALRPRETGEPAIAIRAVDEELPGTDSVTPEPRRFDPTADLARDEPRRFRRDAADDAPRPARFERELDDAPVAPSFTPSVAAIEPPEPVDDTGPQRLEQTAYRNRFGSEKLRALEEFGGSVETERAVAAGLAYLARIQNTRGHWGERRDFDDKYRDVRVGKTGLCLLAFLGAGHSQSSDTEYSEVAEKAIGYLLSTQDGRTGHFGDSSSYGHGIATYALGECFAITEDERLRKPLERAIGHVLAEQQRVGDRNADPRIKGGWGYYYKDGSVWNRDRWPRISVTAWQVMALESAKLGGLAVPDRAFDAAQEFLLNSWDRRRGAFRYSHDPNRLNGTYPILPASTPAALFALSLLGVDVARDELREARRFVTQRAPHGYAYRSDDDFVFRGVGNLYFWYYGTLAMFRVGGDEWRRWNAAMKDTLLEGQEEDGSWAPISIYAIEYAGDDDDERTYSTAMCVLTLEVYYRYFTPLLTAR